VGGADRRKEGGEENEEKGAGIHAWDGGGLEGENKLFAWDVISKRRSVGFVVRQIGRHLRVAVEPARQDVMPLDIALKGPAPDGMMEADPRCGGRTLAERGGFEICPVCSVGR
jgi:hypothetical protein